VAKLVSDSEETCREQAKQEKQMTFSLLMMLASFVPGFSGKPLSLSYKTDDAKYTLTFDSSRISESRMRELVILSPFIVDYTDANPTKDFWAVGSIKGSVVDKKLLALPLEQCLQGDPAYRDCANNYISSPNFLRNAEINLERTGRGLARLQRLDYPKELQPAVQFLLDGLALSLWIEETRFKYYSTWDESILKQAHDGIDPVQICPEAFQKLEATSSKDEKYRIVRFVWANCMIKAIDHQLDSYPINSWDDFRKSYGITEHYEQKGPD
jgi:hypothetical protein